MDKPDLEKMQKFNEEYEKIKKEIPFKRIDEITRDIKNRQDADIAMDFTSKIGKMLRKNGVTPHITKCKSDIKVTCDPIKDKVSYEQKYGIIFDSLDFTEHDKPFKDEIKELEKELKKIETEINQIDDILNELFGVEHDVVKMPEEFKKILKEKAENYKTAFDIIPAEPIKVADMLINAEEEQKTNSIERMLGAGEKQKYNIFSISDLRQIAEHLIVYCNYNSEE